MLVQSAPHALHGHRARRWRSPRRRPIWEFSPVMLQLVTLAPLNFAELFNTDVHMVRKVLGQVLILGFFGMFPGALTMCISTVYALPVYFDRNTGTMFGTMLAASDPVLASLREKCADPAA